MGIYTSGGMILGSYGSELKEREELFEWAEDNELEYMSPYFDSDPQENIFGYLVPDVAVADMDAAWIAGIKEKAEKFKKLTGVDAFLIGTQDVT